MNEQLKNDFPEISKAVFALLTVCDGARTRDNCGYNGCDSVFVNSIINCNYCTTKMAVALYKILRKYHKQLSGLGICYDDISEPKNTGNKNKKELVLDKKIIIKKGTNGITFDSPYDAKLVSLYRKDRFSGWDPANRVNYVQLGTKWTTQNLSVASYFIESAKELGWKIDIDEFSKKKIETARKKISKIKSEKEKADKLAVKNRSMIQSIRTDFTIDLSNELIDSGIKLTPHPYQMAGIKAIDISNGRFLVGDQMGLGKTMQAICWAVLRNKKTLVICPASLKFNWHNEVAKFSSATSMVAKGKWNSDSQFTIVNYEQLKKYMKDIEKSKFDLVIMDESHYIKNSKAMRTKNALAVAKLCKHVIMLTGTAIKSRPAEFFTQLKLLDSNEFGHFWNFAHHYCNAKNNGFGWDFSGASNLDELSQKIGHVYIRRNKSEVLSDLPDKVRQTIRIHDNKACSINDDSLCHEEALAGIQIARAEVSRYKSKYIIEWIREFLDQNDNEKLIVFSSFLDVIADVEFAFPGILVKVTGEVNVNIRQDLVDEFQNNNKCRIFAGTTAAAGVGLNLFAASTVLFCDLPWTPSDVVQAEDRAHRIGQKNTVNIYRLIFEGTIEEDMDELLEEKYKILEQVLEGKKESSGMGSMNIQAELIKRLKRRAAIKAMS